MARLKLFAALLVFGLVVPFALYRLSRLVGLPLMIAAAFFLGLAYGALKADHPWSGEGLASNLFLMAVSALALALYAGLSVAAARAISRLRR